EPIGDEDNKYVTVFMMNVASQYKMFSITTNQHLEYTVKKSFATIGSHTIFVDYPGNARLNPARGEASLTITPGVQQAPTVAPEIAETQMNAVTLKEFFDGQSVIEYGCAAEDTAVSEILWQKSPIFGSLVPGTTYHFYTRKAETAYRHPSPASPATTIKLPSVIETTSLPQGVYGEAYEAGLAIKVEGDISWTVLEGALPQGLSIRENAIVGRPMETGSFEFTVQAKKDAQNLGTQSLSLVVTRAQGDLQLVIKNGDEETQQFHYGDVITIEGQVTPSSKALTRSSANKEVALYFGEQPLGEAVPVEDGHFSLCYDTATKRLPIGESQRLAVHFSGNDQYTGDEKPLTVSLLPRKLSVSLQGDLCKLYDGNSAVLSPVFVINGILDGDDIAVSGRANYEDATAGANKSISLSLDSITGNEEQWYDVQPDQTLSGRIEKAKRALTITGLPSAIYAGDEFSLQTAGGSEEGEVQWHVINGPAKVSNEGWVEVTGSGDISLLAEKLSDSNYHDAQAEINFEALARSSEPSGNDDAWLGYRPALSESLGGKASVQPARAKSGQRVKIRPQVEAGYVLADISVYNKEGACISLVKENDGTYSFIQPNGRVRIDIRYERIEMSVLQDVSENDWFFAPVQFVYDHGLMTGTAENIFSPNLTMSRGMVVAVLHRMAGEPTAFSANFEDVSVDAWYAEAASWAAEVGVVSGVNSTHFLPNGEISREQLAVMLYNYACYTGCNIAPKDSLTAYHDAESISTWAQDAMQWAVAQGVIRGTDTYTLAPKASATRAEVAAILMR
ncbi:MAG: S-layer homology domain-containing protein, partial [Peptococcaceae bacterium]|nr:S-layer homology domain-containing protein [Peptococcaceae bacterium]